MTLVVTGAAGWFGQAFMDLLADKDVTDVRAVVMDSGDVGIVRALVPQAQVVVADLTDPDDAARVFAGIDECEVVHAAGVIHPQRVSGFYDSNVTATGNLVRAALGSGLRRFVHLSSNSPIGVNPSPAEWFRDNEPYQPYLGYGRSKMAGEVLVTEALGSAGVPGVILRPPWFYGRFQPDRQARFLKSVRSGTFPMVGSGDNMRSMVDVDRLAAAAWAALGSESRNIATFWVADATAYSMKQVVTAVWDAAEAVGLPVRRRVLRLPAVTSTIAERVDRLLQSRGIYHQEIHVAGELGKNIACHVAGATSELGFEPATDLVAGLERSYRWGLEHGQDV